MKLFELFATIRLDDKEFTDGVKRSARAGKELSSSMDGISAKAVVLGNVLYNAGVKAGQMAGNFVKSSLEAAAQVQAEKAQFESAFGSMAGVATSALKRVEGETGILYTRLRTVGTKAFSQLKGAGLDASDAMAATEKYTQLAADAAAYYDISLEDADTRLRSFMRGNTEAGDAIGLFTSEAQRNQRALEKYGQGWLKLTEAQKQMLMLDIAGGIYQQSGAIGQAARESDSWTNILGNLDEAWKQSTARFGQPVKEAFSPAIQGLIDYLNDEDTQIAIEQVGLRLADAFTSLYEGEDSPLSNVIAFVGDISTALSSDTGKGVVAAAGIAGGAILAITHPVAAVATAVIGIVTNWNKVKDSVIRAKNAVLEFFNIQDAPGTEAEIPPEKAAELVDKYVTPEQWNSFSNEEKMRTLELFDEPISNAIKQKYSSDPLFAGSFTGSSGTGHVGGGGGSSPLGENEYRLMTPTEVEEYKRREANPSNARKNDEEVSYSSFYGHAKGLSYVPYDNYMALLHRGEEVLTAAQAEKRRNGEGFDLSGMYEVVAAAVRAGVSSIAVNLDGRRVGEIVSRHQAAQTETELMSRGFVIA